MNPFYCLTVALYRVWFYLVGKVTTWLVEYRAGRAMSKHQSTWTSQDKVNVTRAALAVCLAEGYTTPARVQEIRTWFYSPSRDWRKAPSGTFMEQRDRSRSF